MAIKRKKKVICLIGMDGSGKTTSAQKIVVLLQKSKAKCKYVWFGESCFLSAPFMFVCNKLGFTKTYYFSSDKICSERQYYKNKPIATIWPWVRFFDVSIFFIICVCVPLRIGFNIVCDRFIHDSLVEIMVDINDFKLHEKLVGRMMLGLAPLSAIVFFLDLDESTALERKQDIPNLEYLTLRRKGYLMITEFLCIPAVDAKQPLVNVQRDIVSSLRENIASESLDDP